MLPTLDEIPKKRKALGLTQSKLAKIESGTVDPSYSIAKRLVEALEKESIQTSRPRVSEIMSRPVISVSKTQLVREAVDLMRKRGYSQLPVFDGSRCVVSISENTILARAARGEPLESLLNNRVRDIMDSPLPIVNDDTPLEMVLGLLQGNYGVLVTKGESTIGILTKSDILKVKQ